MSTADLTPAAAAFAGPEAQVSETAPIDEDLLVRVLEPYSYKDCRYLLDAQYKATEDSVFALGNFSITESAYIRGTGHFNAAEFLIAFNQLAYSAFAPAILNEEIPVLRGWSIADYFDYQLPSMLIKTSSLRFRRPINAPKFSARLLCKDFEIVERTWRYLKVPCTIEFWDEDGGAASGDVELAALNIP
ncbi:FcoT family thioesterase [Mycolicibacterium komossense]|uniref:(2E)-enoyl-[ACP] glycyltransferase n=1 Tax=Mycolicibacterium komossense TaxID=1779 RepID=A0ABT3CGI7_9MYCO|nr:FcoT family thioesterase [Mycolicibacterium komossense]MCV7228492.1 FcoT family thioesterase [Mycolicibacterium komossense]